eukprot:TRINITY_DN38713_c0_g1_i2.p1 TRINITY_DN38713_c0_g1~~TRINITY_DN38713_c0_g1_i2.p1  ORF type:complete len:219 (+),score=35.00 TRINITY_DN38713_c0_g1_i2:99-659(+)
MKITDLTHQMCSGMPVFPGTEGPIFEKANTLEKDGFRETIFKMYSHTGTHIDAPAHMLDGSPYLDNLSIDKFIGSATVLDFSNENSEIINIDFLKENEEKIEKVQFIILKTGWDKYWGEKEYFEKLPSLSEESAKWLTKFKLKGIGIDGISIDSLTSTTFAVHKICLLYTSPSPRDLSTSRMPSSA